MRLGYLAGAAALAALLPVAASAVPTPIAPGGSAGDAAIFTPTGPQQIFFDFVAGADMSVLVEYDAAFSGTGTMANLMKVFVGVNEGATPDFNSLVQLDIEAESGGSFAGVQEFDSFFVQGGETFFVVFETVMPVTAVTPVTFFLTAEAEAPGVIPLPASALFLMSALGGFALIRARRAA